MSETPPITFRLTLDAGAHWLDEDVLLSGSSGRLLRFAAGRGADIRRLLDGSRTTWQEPLTRQLVGAGVASPVWRDLPVPDHLPTTVVIPYGGGDVERLRALVSSVRGRPTIIVDDRGAAAPDLELPSDVEVLVHKQNRGPAAARNTGWKAAATPLVAFIDADAIPSSSWVEDLSRHLIDPRLAVVAPRVTAASGMSWRHAYEAVRCPLDMGPDGGLVRHGTARPYVPSTAWLARRRALDAVGGFNEGLRLGEDVDLAWRLERDNWRIRYEPEVVVKHEPRGDLCAWLNQRFAYGRSSAALWTEHGDWLRHVELTVPTALPWLVALEGHPVAGLLLAGALTQWTAQRVPLPPKLRRRIVAKAIWNQGDQIAQYTRRVASVPLVLAAPQSRLARRLLLASAIPYLLELTDVDGARLPKTYPLLRVADDLAYALGAWLGAITNRDLGSLSIRIRPQPRMRRT